MTSKRNLEKRLERLEAEREAKRMPSAAELGWEIDEELTEAIIALSHRRLEQSSDRESGDVSIGLPTAFQALDEMYNDEDETA